MRLHVTSDLHLRPGAELPPPPDADVLVLAGDVGTGVTGLVEAAAWWDGPIVYVPGNHEAYGAALPDATDLLRVAAGALAGRVHVLDRDAVVLDGVRILGTTLWSAYDLGGPEEHERALAVAARVVMDFRHVRWAPEDRPLRPADVVALHRERRAWLQARLAEPHDGPTVVVTHHAPLPPPVPPPDAVRRAVAGAFTTDLTALMGGDRVALWAFGHLHRVVDADVRGTRVLANPRGRAGEPVAGHDPGLVVTV